MAPRRVKANGLGVQVEDTQICVVMVGLPARGKSLIAQKGTSILQCYFKTLQLIQPLYSSALPQMAVH